jgi:DNA modification methylase
VKPNAQRKLLHPTEKNVDMLEFIIQLTSKPDDIVLDFAMGSGSTCVAAKQCGRGYIGIELNSDYYETAEERLEG